MGLAYAFGGCLAPNTFSPKIPIISLGYGTLSQSFGLREYLMNQLFGIWVTANNLNV